MKSTSEKKNKHLTLTDHHEIEGEWKSGESFWDLKHLLHKSSHSRLPLLFFYLPIILIS